MRKLASFVFIFSLAALSGSAQRYTNARPAEEEWVSKPIIHPVPPEYANEPAIVLLNDVSMDYRVEGQSVNMYTSQHRIIKVLDDRGIENFNTLDLPVYFGTRVPSVRARVIQPNGKVKEIVKDMILVTRNPMGYWSIIIAMEGVTKNSEIEFLINEIHSAEFFGDERFQFGIPVLETHFSMSYPKNYFFEEKGYNGFPDVQDTLINNRRHISVSVYDIPKLRPEPASFYDLYTMRAEFRLDHYYEENATNKRILYSWEYVGRKYYDSYYKTNEKEKAAVNQFLSELGVRPNGNEFENLKKIENGIKTMISQYAFVDYDDRKEVLATRQIRSVSIYDVAADETKNPLDSIISKRAATSSGIIKLFVACFVQAGVNFEYGAAGNRHEHLFDSKFVNLANLDEPLFYFPDFKQFLDPVREYYRYPVVPEWVLNNKGVFCTIPPNGFVTGPVSKIRKITALPGSETQSNIAAAVSFTKDMDAQVDVSYSYTGYESADLREELATITKEKQKDLVKKTVSFAGKPDDILKYTISNETPDNYYENKPLEITATVNTSALTEDAGKNYLFKVGKIAGNRNQLYNEDKRKLPVDLDYPYSSTRTITLNLPVGYKVLNPEALRMHAEYVNSDLKPAVSFKSDYTLTSDKKNGDKLVITVSEYYDQLHFSPEYYDRYRKVVNMSADFSHVALLISKKDNGKPGHKLVKK
jgi:hypothetical protein